MADGDEEEDSRGEEEGEGGGGGGGGGEDLDEEAVDLMIKRMGERRFEKLQGNYRIIFEKSGILQVVFMKSYFYIS